MASHVWRKTIELPGKLEEGDAQLRYSWTRFSQVSKNRMLLRIRVTICDACASQNLRNLELNVCRHLTQSYHSSVRTPRKKSCLGKILLLGLGKQNSPIWMKIAVNVVAMARHGPILDEHGTTACMDLLEKHLICYRTLYDRFGIKMVDFQGFQISGTENIQKNYKSL